MPTYTASEIASSPHPHDWGRAISRAMDHLLEQARRSGYNVEGHTLFGERLQLTISKSTDGVRVTLQWTPEAETLAEPEAVEGDPEATEGEPAGSS